MTKKDNMMNKTDHELMKLLAETREQLRLERFSAVAARAKDSNAPKKLRATVARVLTEQHARALRSLGEVGRELKVAA